MYLLQTSKSLVSLIVILYRPTFGKTRSEKYCDFFIKVTVVKNRFLYVKAF